MPFQKNPNEALVTPACLLVDGFRTKQELWNHASKKAKEQGITVSKWIEDNVTGILLDGNHRHAVKEAFKKKNLKEFEGKPYWNRTMAMLFVGMTEKHAR